MVVDGVGGPRSRFLDGNDAAVGRTRCTICWERSGAATVHEAELNGPAGFRKRVTKIVRNMLDEANQQDLVNEARLGLLRHANVVDIYELGEEEGRVYRHGAGQWPDHEAVGRAAWPPPAEVALELCRQITRG